MKKRAIKTKLWIPDLKKFREQKKLLREKHILRLDNTDWKGWSAEALRHMNDPQNQVWGHCEIH